MATVSSTSNSNSSYQAVIDKINGTGTTSTTNKVDEMQSNFLKLLMTQLKNQDPTNPLDNAQMTSQLAQMNTIRAIQDLGTSMDKMVQMFDTMQSVEATSMIGKYVLAPGSGMSLVKGSAMAGINLAADAAKVTVNITDSAGKLIATQDLGALKSGQQGFSWDGKDSNGNTVADGNYKFKVTAVDKAGKTVTADPLQLGMVNAVIKDKGSFTLDLGQQGTIALSDVKRVM